MSIHCSTFKVYFMFLTIEMHKRLQHSYLIVISRQEPKRERWEDLDWKLHCLVRCPVLVCYFDPPIWVGKNAIGRCLFNPIYSEISKYIIIDRLIGKMKEDDAFLFPLSTLSEDTQSPPKQLQELKITFFFWNFGIVSNSQVQRRRTVLFAIHRPINPTLLP